MAYTKTNWVNGTTPINATNLNHIEDGIESVEQEIPSVYSTPRNTTTTDEVYNCGYINYIEANLKNANTYSTNEIDTGKIWIDGKHIYRRYIPLPDHPTTTSPFTKALDLSNIEKIWLDTIHSQWVSTLSGNLFQFPYYDGSGYVGFYFTISNGAPTLNVRHNQNIYWIYLVVEYTKTTD